MITREVRGDWSEIAQEVREDWSEITPEVRGDGPAGSAAPAGTPRVGEVGTPRSEDDPDSCPGGAAWGWAGGCPRLLVRSVPSEKLFRMVGLFRMVDVRLRKAPVIDRRAIEGSASSPSPLSLPSAMLGLRVISPPWLPPLRSRLRMPGSVLLRKVG